MSVNTFSKRTEIDLRSIQLRSILVWMAPYKPCMATQNPSRWFRMRRFPRSLDVAQALAGEMLEYAWSKSPFTRISDVDLVPPGYVTETTDYQSQGLYMVSCEVSLECVWNDPSVRPDTSDNFLSRTNNACMQWTQIIIHSNFILVPYWSTYSS